jgi:hypothetical protein
LRCVQLVRHHNCGCDYARQTVIFAVLISYSVTALRSGWISLANHHWHGCTGARVAWHALQLFIQRSIVRGVIALLSILPEAKGRHHLIGGTSLKCLSLSAHGFRCTHSNQAFVPYWTGQEDLVFHLSCQCLEVRACISCFALMIIPVCSRWELASAHHACPALDKALKHNIYYDICAVVLSTFIGPFIYTPRDRGGRHRQYHASLTRFTVLRSLGGWPPATDRFYSKPLLYYPTLPPPAFLPAVYGGRSLGVITCFEGADNRVVGHGTPCFILVLGERCLCSY